MNSPTDYTRDAAILRACRSMATVDLGRAVRIAERLRQPPYPGQPERPLLVFYAHAVMADALAGSNPEAARRILDETMAGLRPIARDDSSAPDRLQAVCLLASFLTIVERIAPDRLEECLWEVIACRPSRSDELDLQQVRALAILAAFVARYDPTAAEVIAEPVLQQVPRLAIPRFPSMPISGLDDVFKALACVDPRRAAALADRLPADRVIPKSRPRRRLPGRTGHLHHDPDPGPHRPGPRCSAGRSEPPAARKWVTCVVNPWLIGEPR